MIKKFFLWLLFMINLGLPLHAIDEIVEAASKTLYFRHYLSVKNFDKNIIALIYKQLTTLIALESYSNNRHEEFFNTYIILCRAGFTDKALLYENEALYGVFAKEVDKKNFPYIKMALEKGLILPSFCYKYLLMAAVQSGDRQSFIIFLRFSPDARAAIDAHRADSGENFLLLRANLNTKKIGNVGEIIAQIISNPDEDVRDYLDNLYQETKNLSSVSSASKPKEKCIIN